MSISSFKPQPHPSETENDPAAEGEGLLEG
jgi:hypothetical protein